MGSADFVCLPLLLLFIFSLVGLILIELAPNLLKLSLIENSIESMAVKIPTRQVIPTAMISNVSEVLRKLAFKEYSAILMFSERFNVDRLYDSQDTLTRLNSLKE